MSMLLKGRSITMLLLLVMCLCISLASCGENVGTPDDSHQPVLELVRTVDISNDLFPSGQRSGRPDAVVIGEEIYLTFGSPETFDFYLKRFQPTVELESLGPTETLHSGHPGRIAIDIRASKDDTRLWYAYEDSEFPSTSCGTRYLNAARYDITPQIVLDSTQNDLATGCTTLIPEAFNVDPEDVLDEWPEAVDDPTPLFFQDNYYILTRAWSGWIPEYTPVPEQHIRQLNGDFELSETFILDLSAVFSDRTLSQNALVDIEGTPYLIGGFYKSHVVDLPGNASGIYAVPLSEDLKSISGDAIPLIEDERWVIKSTSAVYEAGRLYINFQSYGSGVTQQWLAAFDVEQEFEKLAEVELQSYDLGESILANHTTVVAKNDLAFAIYPIDGDIMHVKIFQWK